MPRRLEMPVVGQGRKTTERACTACHGLGLEVTAGRTPAAWRKVVEEMVAMGTEANPDEVRAIVAYLAHSFPAK